MSKTLFYTIAKLTFVVAIIFGFVASMATALDPAVSAAGAATGKVAFAMTLTFMVLSGADGVASSNLKSYAEFREGDKGVMTKAIVNAVAGFTIIVLTIVSLILAPGAL